MRLSFQISLEYGVYGVLEVQLEGKKCKNLKNEFQDRRQTRREHGSR